MKYALRRKDVSKGEVHWYYQAYSQLTQDIDKAHKFDKREQLSHCESEDSNWEIVEVDKMKQTKEVKPAKFVLKHKENGHYYAFENGRGSYNTSSLSEAFIYTDRKSIANHEESNNSSWQIVELTETLLESDELEFLNSLRIGLTQEEIAKVKAILNEAQERKKDPLKYGIAKRLELLKKKRAEWANAPASTSPSNSTYFQASGYNSAVK